jgi:hypothetical protein
MIRDVLDRLDMEDRRLLSYALDHDLSQTVKLPQGKFVGINIHPGANMVIEEQVGNWCYGSYRGEQR